ncbi:MAG: hypothetical protein ACLGG0_06830 [Bacteriovoracia bacterium]
MKKVYKYIILVAAFLTMIFIIALASSVTNQWWTGALIGLGITALFGAIIAYGAYDMRARAHLPVAQVSSHEIEIQLPHPHPRLNFPVLKFFIAIGLFLAMLDLVLVVNDAGPQQLTHMFVGMNLGFLFFAAIICWVKTAPLNAARALVNKHPTRKFILNEKGLEIPLELLTIPAFHIALREGKASIIIPWKEILSFEAHRQRGSSPRQFSLKTSGETEKYGGLMGSFGVICDAALVAQESNILASARRYLHNTLSVHFDNSK